MTDNPTHEARWAGRNTDKDALRNAVWGVLEERAAAVGSPWNHIPNFVGAEQAAERLAELPIWTNARVVKANPDAPQIPVRLRALQDGKLLYMPIPALVEDKPFVLLDPADLKRRGVAFEDAAVAKQAIHLGQKVNFDEMQPIDLIVTGCVAVTRGGGRTGKGAGFADLELGIMREYGIIQPETPMVTTVHPLQVVDEGRVVMQGHDTPLNWIVTPEEVIETRTAYPQPHGMDWDAVQPDQYRDIPFLRALRDRLKR